MFRAAMQMLASRRFISYYIILCYMLLYYIMLLIISYYICVIPGVRRVVLLRSSGLPECVALTTRRPFILA